MNCPFCNDDRILQAQPSGLLELHIQNMRFFRSFRCHCCGEHFFAWALRTSTSVLRPIKSEKCELTLADQDSKQQSCHSWGRLERGR